MNYSTNINLKRLLPKNWLQHISSECIDEVSYKLQREQLKTPQSEFYPYNEEDIFKIFHLCSLENIKIVILGQDPYYSSKYQANGIAFSVNKDIIIPPSLKNIFKEVEMSPSHGDLTNWVKQGVFLLNASLTVKEGSPNSHKIIWNRFITHIINIINEKCKNIIFVAWGNSALAQYSKIDLTKHSLLTSSHPSPLSCYKTSKPFMGSKVFEKINQINNVQINWKAI